MISYCIAVYRPVYARRLVEDLVRKTSTPFEILLWLNTDDAAFEQFVSEGIAAGAPLRIVGRSPENTGMRAYASLFQAARFPLITQIDDDVVCVSRHIAERAARLFASFPSVRQIVADVWQDELTTGARPPLAHYRCVNAHEGLYEGPVDGWFSIYHRSILPLLLPIPCSQYCCIGGTMQIRLRQRQLRGLLCTRMKVFHVIGPDYASAFGMLEFEIEKYRRLGRTDIVKWYEDARPAVQPADVLDRRVADIAAALEDAEAW